MADNKINVGGRLHSIATGNVLAGANEILDDTKNKKQSEVNAEVDTKLTQLENTVDALQKQDIEAVTSLPAVGSADPKKIYRVAGETSYTDYMLNAAGTQFVAIATYSFPGIDSEPTADSDNLVKSGGVQSELALGTVYDVSAKNPTAGTNNDGKFESLSVLLSDANLNTLIPIAVRRGGMSIKFIQSSDNKYVRYNYLISSVDSDDFTNVANWIGVDDALENVSEISKTDTSDDDNFVSIEDEEGNTVVKITPDGVDAKNLKSNGVDVLTESDKDDLATKEDIEILDMITEDETSDDTEEQSWQSDNGEETFAAIGTYGIKAKAYYDINGNPIPTEPIPFDPTSITIPTDLTQYKSTIVGLKSDACKDNNMNNVFGTQDLGRHCQESVWINVHGEVSFLSIWNCAFGYHSMFQTYNGNYNVGFGNETLDNLTVGDWNTAIGTNALQMRGNSNKECTSYQSTAVGANSQRYSYNRRGNTSLGFETLSGNGTDGTTTPSVSCRDYNIAIGFRAGKYATNDLELYIGSCTNSNSYSNNAEEKACTLMYGKSDENKNIANQFLKVNGMFAANGVTPQSPLTAEADATDLATAIILLNQIKDALIKSGIMKTSNV